MKEKGMRSWTIWRIILLAERWGREREGSAKGRTVWKGSDEFCSATQLMHATVVRDHGRDEGPIISSLSFSTRGRERRKEGRERRKIKKKDKEGRCKDGIEGKTHTVDGKKYASVYHSIYDTFLLFYLQNYFHQP